MLEPAPDDWYTFASGRYSTESFVNVWLVALAFYGVGDVVSSIALIWFSPRHVEANPVIAAAISAFGGGGYLGLKLLAFFCCLAISLWAGYQHDDTLLFYGPPLLLAAVGFIVTVSNVWILL